MQRELGRKLLSAMHRIGVQDREGIPLDDPVLERISADAGLEFDDSDDQTRMNEEANDYAD